MLGGIFELQGNSKEQNQFGNHYLSCIFIDDNVIVVNFPILFLVLREFYRNITKYTKCACETAFTRLNVPGRIFSPSPQIFHPCIWERLCSQPDFSWIEAELSLGLVIKLRFRQTWSKLREKNNMNGALSGYG